MRGTERLIVASSVSVMRVEWMEVWTLLLVRYTCFILVYIIACIEAPIPCSGHTLASIPQSGSGLSPTSRHATCRVEGLILLQTNEQLISRSTSPKEV
jgi:hypothetical protein